MNEERFIETITPHLDYSPDSANYDLYQIFLDLIVADGGDDDFAHLDEHEVALAFSKRVTLAHIEMYGNENSEVDIYLAIKPQVLQHYNL